MPRIARKTLVLLLSISLFLSLDGRPAAAAVSSAPGVAVLVFHQITPGPNNSVTMSPEDFDATLLGLKNQGYTFIDLDTMHNYLDGNAQLADKSLLITFDDGYQDVYEHAHPLLVKHQIPAVMFLITMYYEEGYPLPQHYIPHLSRDDIKAMQDSGWWDFGGHSFNGHRLIQTAPGKSGPFFISLAWLGDREETQTEYMTRISEDIASMGRIMGELSLPVTDFAPPNNAMNSSLQQVLASQGFRYLYLQDHRLNYPGSSIVYRITVSSSEQALRDVNTLFEASATPPPVMKQSPADSPDTDTLKAFSSEIKKSIYNKKGLVKEGDHNNQ